MTTNTTDYRRDRMTTAEIQRDLDLIRLAYRDSGCTPNNRRRVTPEQWIGIGLLTATVTVCAVILTIL